MIPREDIKAAFVLYTTAPGRVGQDAFWSDTGTENWWRKNSGWEDDAPTLFDRRRRTRSGQEILAWYKTARHCCGFGDDPEGSGTQCPMRVPA